ncbi:DNA polymerase III PolC [compost metagenome]
MSTERCEKEGVPISEVLPLIVEEINKADIIVAHNSAFDMPVLKCEMIRYGFKAKNSPVEICTMKSSVDYCKIPHANGRGYKWPQLGELYKLLFSEDMGLAHDAFADTTAARKCFFKLIELKQIILK